jgi:hypothetical protein
MVRFRTRLTVWFVRFRTRVSRAISDEPNMLRRFYCYYTALCNRCQVVGTV